MSIGKRILYYLERNEMQQKELAQKINLDAAVLNRIIKESRPARDNELSAIANVFNISTDELLGRDAPKPTAIMEEMTRILSQPTDGGENPTKEMLDDYSSLSAEGKEKARSYIKYLASEDKEARIKKDYGKSTMA